MGGQKPPFGRLRKLTATLTAYIFGTIRDIDNRSSALTTTGVSYIVPKCHERLQTGPPFLPTLCKFCFLRHRQTSADEISKQNSTILLLNIHATIVSINPYQLCRICHPWYLFVAHFLFISIILWWWLNTKVVHNNIKYWYLYLTTRYLLFIADSYKWFWMRKNRYQRWNAAIWL